MNKAGRVTKEQRELARAQANDQEAVMAAGKRAALAITNRAARAALAAYRRGADPASAYHNVVVEALPRAIQRSMTYARLKGIRRSLQTAPISIRFQSEVHEAAVGYLRRLLDVSRTELREVERTFETNALDIASKASAAVETKLRRTMAEITADGAHTKEGVARLTKAFKDSGVTPHNSFSIEAVYRTQTALAYSAGRQDVEADPDINEILWGYTYVTVGDDRVRPEHAALDGTTAPKDDPIWNTIYPPNGWACLLPGTVVEGAVLGASKAWYSGEAIELETSGGNRLSVTANHPILTSRGWIAANQCREGDDLFEYSRNIEFPVLGAIYDQHSPAAVQDAFNAIATQRAKTFSTLPAVRLSMLDFHGETKRFQGDVYVVGSYGELRRRLETRTAKPIQKRDFTLRYAPHPLIAGLRHSYPLVPSLNPPGSGFPRAAALSLDTHPVALHSCPLDPLLFGLASGCDVVKPEPSIYDPASHAVFLRQLQNAGPGRIIRNKLRRIRAFNWHGHVYDLHTKTGWMVSNGIITSNCRCQVIAIYEPAEVKKPPSSVEVDGKTIIPGADAGFRFQPRQIFGSLPQIVVPDGVEV